MAVSKPQIVCQAELTQYAWFYGRGETILSLRWARIPGSVAKLEEGVESELPALVGEELPREQIRGASHRRT
jgi:hypothetical protein